MDTIENFGGVATRSGGARERADVELLCAPYEGTVSYGGGTAAAPAAILEASLQVETYDDETGVILDELSYALGPVVEPHEEGGETVEAYLQRVRTATRAAASAGRIPFLLGGEHSVTIGALAGVRDVHGPVHVLSLDAHADLRDAYEGERCSHACVCRRALEDGPVTIVGARSWSPEEAEFLAGRPEALHLVPAREAVGGRLDVDALVARLGDPVYVTVDVDGFDPSVVPDTGTPEPGGFAWWDALALLRAVASARRVVGLDVVELAPVADRHVSDFTVARLVAKLLSYVGPGLAPSGADA